MVEVPAFFHESQMQVSTEFSLKRIFHWSIGVLDATNVVFSHLMDRKEIRDILYDQDYMLVAGSDSKEHAWKWDPTTIYNSDGFKVWLLTGLINCSGGSWLSKKSSAWPGCTFWGLCTCSYMKATYLRLGSSFEEHGFPRYLTSTN